MTAHPGAFCSPAGATGETRAGTDMVCTVAKPGDRARWRRNGPAPARTPRKRGTKASAAKSGTPLPAVDVGINPVAAPVPEPPAAPKSVDDRIRDVYADLASRDTTPGHAGWVKLADLREALGDTPRAEVDAALRRLLNDNGVRLEPEPFGSRTGQRERDNAIHIGGEDRHHILIK